MIHYARLDKSKRLQRVKFLLSNGKWYSTRQIIQFSGVCAVSTVIAELRKNGLSIECKCFGRADDGAMIYKYRMVA